jgi:hypothetical protein
VRRAWAAPLVAVVTAVLLLAQVPAAVAAPAGRHNQWFLIFARVEGPTARLLGFGRLSGVGTLTAESATFDEPARSYEETDVIALEGGTLTVAVRGSFRPWPFALERPSCTRRGTLTGTWTITDSGGGWAGAAGGGTLSGVFFTYGPRAAGGCDTSAVKGFAVGPMSGRVDIPR